MRASVDSFGSWHGACFVGFPRQRMEAILTRRGAWEFDGNELVGPYGLRIALKDILRWRMAANTGRQYLQTEKWRGWRIVQQFIVPPGRTIRTCPIHVNHLKSLAYRIERGIDEFAGIREQTIKERFDWTR